MTNRYLYSLFIASFAFTAACAVHAQTMPPPPPTLDYFELKQKSVDPTLVSAPSPVMPTEATRSGYCCVDFDISAAGKAVSVKTSYCSEDLFRVAAITSVRDAEFTPAKVGGVRRMSEGHSFDVTFKKEDYNGVLKPSADGKLTRAALDAGIALCPF